METQGDLGSRQGKRRSVNNTASILTSSVSIALIIAVVKKILVWVRTC